MNKTGKSESEDTDQTSLVPEDEALSRRSPALLIVLAGVLIVCLVIGLQAFGILYSIFFPPLPPVPEFVNEVRHTVVDHGVDEWLYRTEQNACEIVRFYELMGGQCRIPTGICEDQSSDNIVSGNVGQHVATCVGEVQFNIFAYRWETEVRYWLSV